MSAPWHHDGRAPHRIAPTRGARPPRMGGASGSLHTEKNRSRPRMAERCGGEAASGRYPELVGCSGRRSGLGKLSGAGDAGNVCHAGHTALGSVSKKLSRRARGV